VQRRKANFSVSPLDQGKKSRLKIQKNTNHKPACREAGARIAKPSLH